MQKTDHAAAVVVIGSGIALALASFYPLRGLAAVLEWALRVAGPTGIALVISAGFAVGLAAGSAWRLRRELRAMRQGGPL